MILSKLRRTLAGMLLLAFTFAILPASHAAPRQDDGVKRITREEVQALLKVKKGKRAKAKAKVVIVDVRDAASYEAGHIAGALHIPYGEMENRAGELPADKLIVTYCS